MRLARQKKAPARRQTPGAMTETPKWGESMGTSVSKLGYSGWTEEQLARRDAFAWRSPLQRVLRGVSEASLEASNAGRWRMAARDFGNGHKECALWLHQPDIQGDLDRWLEQQSPLKVERGDSDREANVRRAARRAKQQVRHLCKALAVNSLWTLTYRENVTDRDQVLKHLDLFRRRVQEVLGEWKYVAVLEKQERGAWHIHLATHALPVRLVDGGAKVKSWDVMRAIWRRVVGEMGGNFDEAKRRARWGEGRRFKGAGSIASYIGGYVAKEMEDSQLNRKRYSVTKGVELPRAVRAEWEADADVAGLIELAYAAVGDRITRTFFDRERGVFFIESDDSDRTISDG